MNGYGALLYDSSGKLENRSFQEERLFKLNYEAVTEGQKSRSAGARGGKITCLFGGARARAWQSLNTHPLFVIRRVGCVGRAVSRTWLRSQDAPSRPRATAMPPHKVNSRYIIRHEAGTKNFVLCWGASSTSPRLHGSLGKKYRRSIWGENNEKYDAQVIAGQSRTNFS